MSEKERLGRIRDELRLKCVTAKVDQDKTSNNDSLGRALLRGKEEAYWDAVCAIEQEFGVL